MRSAVLSDIHANITALEAVLADIEMESPSDGTVIVLDGGRLILNPGSFGQPRDSDARAAHAIIDTVARQVSFFRVGYDIAAVQERTRKVSIPAKLVTRLE